MWVRRQYVAPGPPHASLSRDTFNWALRHHIQEDGGTISLDDYGNWSVEFDNPEQLAAWILKWS